MSEQYKDELQPFMDEALKNPEIRAAYERASAPPTRPLRKWLPYAMVALVLLAVVTLLVT